MRAAARGHTEVVSELLKVDTINVNLGDQNGNTALVTAVQHGHHAVVRVLLNARDISIDARGAGGYSALTWALKQGMEAISLELLVNGATISSKEVDVVLRENSQITPEVGAAV